MDRQLSASLGKRKREKEVTSVNFIIKIFLGENEKKGKGVKEAF